MTRVLVFLFSLAFWAIPSGPPSAQVVEKVKIGNVREDVLRALPILAAGDKGFWKGLGVEVEYVPFRGATEMHQAVAAVALDTGVAGAASVMLVQARGVPEIIVADLQAPEDFFVWVRTDSRIREVKDLKGAKIGINRFGALLHAYGLMLSKASGLGKDIRLVAGGGTREELAAIKAGVIDGRVAPLTTMAPLKFQGEVREVVAVRDYLPKPWVDLVAFARTDVAEKRPEAVRRTVRGLLQGAQAVLKEPEWAMKKLQTEFGYAEGLARMIYPGLKYGKDGQLERQALDNVRSFLIEYGLVVKEKTPPLDKMFTMEFVQ